MLNKLYFDSVLLRINFLKQLIKNKKILVRNLTQILFNILLENKLGYKMFVVIKKKIKFYLSFKNSIIQNLELKNLFKRGSKMAA